MAEKQEENLVKLKQEYEKIRVKYKLPGFDELDEAFEIRKTDYDLFLVREVRRAMCHKLTAFADLIEPILNPAGHSLHSMIETKIFEKEELDDMYKFYKKLWHLVHKSIYLSLISEKDEAEFIKEAWKGWPEIKKTIEIYAKKISDGWAKEEKESAGDHYLS
jgi:hypothetical protein